MAQEQERSFGRGHRHGTASAARTSTPQIPRR